MSPTTTNSTAPQSPGATSRELATSIGCAALPGLLAGTQVAGLLFFLNPHLEFAPGPVLRAMLVYGGLLGFASLLAHLPFTWDQPRRALRVLPWALVLVFTAAGVAHWTHASFFDFYLPAGINRRLI